MGSGYFEKTLKIAKSCTKENYHYSFFASFWKLDTVGNPEFVQELYYLFGTKVVSIDNYLFLKQMSNNNRTGTFQFRIYFLLHTFFVKTLILSTKNLDRFLIYSQVCSGKKVILYLLTLKSVLHLLGIWLLRFFSCLEE